MKPLTPEQLTLAADAVADFRKTFEMAEKVLRMAALMPDELQDQARAAMRVYVAAHEAASAAAEKEPAMKSRAVEVHHGGHKDHECG